MTDRNDKVRFQAMASRLFALERTEVARAGALERWHEAARAELRREAARFIAVAVAAGAVVGALAGWLL